MKQICLKNRFVLSTSPFFATPNISFQLSIPYSLPRSSPVNLSDLLHLPTLPNTQDLKWDTYLVSWFSLDSPACTTTNLQASVRTIYISKYLPFHIQSYYQTYLSPQSRLSNSTQNLMEILTSINNQAKDKTSRQDDKVLYQINEY